MGQTAETYVIPFFSSYDAFKDTDQSQDSTQKDYIRDDREHPRELGSQY
jgi:hypothetical protein